MRRSFSLTGLLRDDEGATAIEYGLIVALIAMAIFGALNGISNDHTGLWAVVRDKVTAATTPSS